MKIFNKHGMFDSDPNLKCVRLESGAVMLYVDEKPDKTIPCIWKRSMMP